MKRIFWFIPILFVVLGAGLTVITANAAPAGNTTLDAGQKLTIKANGCALKVKKETTTLVVVVCKASTNAKSELAPDAKVTLTAGQKQKVSANGCSLSVTKKTASVVKVKCVGGATATPTNTTTGATATPTRTRTQTPTPTPTQPSGATYRVSIATDGTQGDNPVGASDISADGRYVAFDSYASTLDGSDNNWNCSGSYGENCSDVFVHDMQTGETTLISRASDGTQGNNSSLNPSISADGRYVAFESFANNLVAGDTNLQWDIFVHDRQTGQTVRASVKSDGSEVPYCWVQYPSLSADGQRVAFLAWCGDFGGPKNDDTVQWVYLHDMQTGATTQVSVNSNGDATTGQNGVYNGSPVISANGRYVAFISNADNLASGQTKFPCNDTHTQYVEHCFDVYVHDTQTGETTLVSRDLDGINGGNTNTLSGSVPMLSFSADGRYMRFASTANNFVSGDTNCPNPYYPSCMDVFVYDRQTGQTIRASIDVDGTQFDSDSFEGSISEDGRYVTFTGGGGFNWSAYVRDLQTGQTTIYSLDTNGYRSGEHPSALSISADGQYALFSTDDEPMVPGDNNGYSDLFVRKRW